MAQKFIRQRNRSVIHGDAKRGEKTTEYKIWTGIKVRCLKAGSPAYANYGGRGITICDAWASNFAEFLAGVGRRPSPTHSLDRIDNNRGYEPGNTRWATRSEQFRNKRNNCVLTFNGESKCVSEWAECVGLKRGTLRSRLKLGWTVERALCTPAGPHKASGVRS